MPPRKKQSMVKDDAEVGIKTRRGRPAAKVQKTVGNDSADLGDFDTSQDGGKPGHSGKPPTTRRYEIYI